MNENFSAELRKELLDDFYAECDELLTSIRENLAVLDVRAGAAQIEPLFRNYHSLKGISAIAGVRPAEAVAHGVEDLLRALTRREVGLSSACIEVLMDATQCAEQIIRAHQSGQATPSHDRILQRLAQLGSTAGQTQPPSEPESETVPSPPSAEPVATAEARAARAGLHSWRCMFAPSPQLDAQGINVRSVRERLSEIGTIFSATPSVRPNAAIVFIFIVGLRTPPTPEQLAKWETEGMTFERIVRDSSPPMAVEPAGQQSGSEREDALSLTPSHLVRVDLARLDDLMRIAGDMVIQRSRLEDRIAQQFSGNEMLKEIDLRLARSLRELRRGIARVRLVPIAEIFSRIPLVVRDLSASSDKRVRVVLEGHRTEVDKYLVERLKEPLLHLVRNAFSHGIETSAERIAAGKNPEATLELRATSVGESVVIQVRDDGHGIDVSAVSQRAKLLGVPIPERWDANALLGILCAPGFSTREQADRVSGRGVGMAVVANTVRELGGTLTLETTVGRGTEFTLRLPLTLSIVDAVIVTVGAEICAVPQSAVDEIIQVPSAQKRDIRETEVVPYRGGLLPFSRLAAIFGVERMDPELLTILVLSSERGATGLVVDRVRARREIVVRPMADPLVKVPGILGATELGDGRPILILDPAELTRGAVRPHATATEPVPA